ncbi:TetR family transcriptional regulator [Paraburkholderia xenovorans]|uniref:TetR/AcrR family transcriptional regulator n=1 Tax=Paraburkholderia xenovorans TaxID=36873 RepID=UPI0038BC9192
MIERTRHNRAREDSLSRNRIVEESIALLDSRGESGLTFRALSGRLATGIGAIYRYIDSKNDLLTAACDAVIADMMSVPPVGATPEATIRALALSLFDAIDAHPWVGSVLTQAPAQLPTVRVLERIGQQIRSLDVPDDAQWGAVFVLLNYILGVSGQNAVNAQIARESGTDKSNFLDELSAMWSELDPHEYPFTRRVAGQLHVHDDRLDFLAGIDLILGGIGAARSR